MMQLGSNGTTIVPWGRIEETPIGTIPPQMTGKYLPLYQEICLRLEATSPSMALRVPIDDAKVLQGAYSALKKLFAAHQHPPVVILKRAGALFIYKSADEGRKPGRPRHRGDDMGYEEEAE